MRIQKLDENSRKNLLEDLLKRSPNNYGQYEQGVTEILPNVKANGDQALFEYTKKFDQADLNAGNIKVTDAEIEEAYALVDRKLVEIIRENFDLRPAGIIKMLDLRRPIYKQTAAYGHFGRTDVDLPWEKLDKVEVLKKYI